MLRMKNTHLLACALLFGAACGGTSTAPATLTEVKTSVFKPSCTLSSCHDASSKMGSLDLVTNPYAALINVASVQAGAANEGLKRVVPGDLQKSFLNIKVTLSSAEDPKYGGRMPDTGQTLDANQLNILQGWILAGAPNN